VTVVIGVAGSVAAASTGAPAHAQEAPQAGGERGIELDLQVGYGWPMGHAGRQGTVDADVDVALNALVGSLVPIELHAGYRFNSLLAVGLSLQYAFASINVSYPNVTYVCGPQTGVTCSASDVRIGANVKVHLMSGDLLDPWVALGAGYEWLNFSFAGLTTPSLTYSGFELASLQAGAYLKRPAAHGFAFGPFVGYSLGLYRTFAYGGSMMYAGMTGPFAGKSLHEWLVLGVGGTFDIPL
jgi:hypothetical protein